MMQRPFDPPASVPCIGCRTPLISGAAYCVECGIEALDQTATGTVIAPAPTEPSPPRRYTFTPPPTPAVVAAQSGEFAIELDDDDIEFVDDRARGWTGRWPAPPRGETVVGPAPAPAARITAAYGVIHA